MTQKEYPQRVEKSEVMHQSWKAGDGNMDELAIGLYNLIAEYKALYDDYEELLMSANSLLGLIDCLGGRWSLDDAGPDRKNLAELVDYPDYMKKKIASTGDSNDRSTQ